MRWALAVFFALSIGSTSCARTRYVPTERVNYAFALMDNAVYFHVDRPQVLAMSMTLPFVCDANTVGLATGKIAPPPPEATIEKFGGLQNPYSSKVYRVLTVSGESHDVGPAVIVISGQRSVDAAVSALNVVHRYNDVAECVRRSVKRS